MVRFRRTSQPRNYFARGQQRRLLAMVMGLGLLVLVIDMARDPANYRGLDLLLGDSAGSEEVVIGGPEHAASSEPSESAPPESADSEAPETDDAETDDAETDDAETDDAETDDAKPTTAGRYFPGVKPELLHPVQDNSTFRKEEYPAWFNLLGILNRTEEAKLAEASGGRATYAQLYKQSDAYRGELVTVMGTVHGSRPITAPKNDSKIEKYHQVWLQPFDNPDAAIVVYCLYLPEGFPEGTEIEALATIHGFYFKRWAYRARDGSRIAPVLLARTIHWQKKIARPAQTSAPANSMTWWTVVVAAVGISSLLVACIYFRTRSVPSDSNEEPPDLTSLRVVGEAAEDTATTDFSDPTVSEE